MGKKYCGANGYKGGGIITFLKNVTLFLDVAFAVLIMYGIKNLDNNGKIGAVLLSIVLLLSAFCINV